MSEATHVAIDLETTGLPDYKASPPDFSAVCITEIAAVCVEKNVPVGYFNTLVRVPDGAPWSEQAQAVSGITRAMCDKDGIPVGSALATLQAFLDMHEPSFVLGQNLIEFDLAMIYRTCERVGIDPTGELGRMADHAMDTMLLWKAWWLGLRRAPHESLAYFCGKVASERMGGPRYGLEKVAKTLFGRNCVEQNHRAYWDCLLVERVFGRFVELGIVDHVLGDQWV